MFGAVDFGLLVEIGRQTGVMIQEQLDLGTPPFYFINPEYFCSVSKNLKWYTPDGVNHGLISTMDHPSFTATRDHLESNGYIKTERAWSNGDVVIKAFYLNNYLLLPDDKFPCAPAFSHHSKTKMNYNDGQIADGLKNYREEDDYGII